MAMSYGSAPAVVSPDFSCLQNIIRKCLHSSRIVIQHIEELKGHLHYIYLLRLSDGTRLILKLPSPPNTRLLRHEQRSLETETQLFHLLNPRFGIAVPRLLKSDPLAKSIGLPYTLMDYVPGKSLKDLRPYLTTFERNHIDKQLGVLIYSISQQVSTTFGPVTSVASGTGSRSWREAFLSLMESILRDAEDMFVCLPDEAIREQVERLAPLLDEVTQPRLVILNAGDPASLLLDQETKQITGILDLTDALWGDVLMAEVFVDASTAFFEGFGATPARFGAERSRQLLYSCYQAIVKIVTQYYRPQQNETELEARKKLTLVMSQLAAVQQ
ncbi:MAG: hypothetical protein M1827_000146 [Pycnora praestabilis]|nr:MAG: hypothetical protein M1827_000146 [Pycnora praestabilis]